MAKCHTIGKMVTYQMTAEAARLEMEDAEVQRLTIQEVDGPSAPKMQLNNLDRLVNWSNEEHQLGLPRPHHQGRAGCHGQLGGRQGHEGQEQQEGPAQPLRLQLGRGRQGLT
jgi:hypothetical protein